MSPPPKERPSTLIDLAALAIFAAASLLIVLLIVQAIGDGLAAAPSGNAAVTDGPAQVEVR